jgi:hypothetical protein
MATNIEPVSEEHIEQCRKELETYLRLLKTPLGVSQLLRVKTLFCLHSTLTEDNVWFQKEKTKRQLFNYLLDERNHLVNGKKWTCDLNGSRWVETTLNGKKVRIVFYSKKNDPNTFSNMEDPTKDYGIMLFV